MAATYFRVVVYPSEFVLQIPQHIQQIYIFRFLWQRLESDLPPQAALWKVIKRYVLQASIFKGPVTYQVEDKAVDLEYILSNKPDTVHVNVLNATEPLPTALKLLEETKEKYAHAVAAAPPDRVAEVTERIIRDFTATSNAIEGTTVEIKKVNAIIDANKRPGEEDAREIYGHYNAVKIILEHQHEDVTDVLLFSLHHNLDLALMHDDKKGRFRRDGENIAVKGSAHKFVAGADVAAKMAEYLQWLNSQWGRTDVTALAAEAQYGFVNIHPFADGNGRVGRLVSNIVMIKAGFPLVSIQSQTAPVYFTSLRIKDQHGPLTLLERIWVEACLRSMYIYIAKLGQL